MLLKKAVPQTKEPPSSMKKFSMIGAQSKSIVIYILGLNRLSQYPSTRKKRVSLALHR